MYTCNGCSFSFKTKSILDDHRRNAHGSKGKVEQGSTKIDKDRIIKELRQHLIAERKEKREVKVAY